MNKFKFHNNYSEQNFHGNPRKYWKIDLDKLFKKPELNHVPRPPPRRTRNPSEISRKNELDNAKGYFQLRQERIQSKSIQSSWNNLIEVRTRWLSEQLNHWHQAS